MPVAPRIAPGADWCAMLRDAVHAALDASVPLAELERALGAEARAEALRRAHGTQVGAAAVLRTTRRIFAYGLHRPPRAPAMAPAAARALWRCADCARLYIRPSVSAQLHDLRREVEQLQHRRIDEALAATHGNRALAAQLLGMPRSTLVSWLRRHGGRP